MTQSEPSTLIELNAGDIGLLEKSHQVMFESILKIVPSWLRFSCKEALKNYLVVPVSIRPLMKRPEASINFTLAARVVEAGNPNAAQSRLKWPCTLEDIVLHNAHGCEDSSLFEIESVNKDVTPAAKPPGRKYNSYADYYLKNHQLSINLSQPLLMCAPLTFGKGQLRMVTSRYKDTHGEDYIPSVSNAKAPLEIFPENASRYPLPASFMKIIRCLPSILWRMENLLLVNDLRSHIAKSTGIGRTGCNTVEVTTYTHLQGYQDHGSGKLETAWHFENDSDSPQSIDSKLLLIRGPDNGLLLQALTPASAVDSINNLTLQTLGDFFMKLATSVFLYYDNPDANEGSLTKARSERIGDFNLHLLAETTKIAGKIFSKKFSPTEMWSPSCFTDQSSSTNRKKRMGKFESSELRQNEREYLYHRVTQKRASDCVEGLVGAYLVAGGVEAALRLVQWLGLHTVSATSRVTTPETTSCSNPTQSSTKFQVSSKSVSANYHDNPRFHFDSDANLLIDHSSKALLGHISPPPLSLARRSKKNDALKLLQERGSTLQSEKIQEIINWKFKDPALLLQSLTHKSFRGNSLTDSYERLEFLGDAVLDYLLTVHLYTNFPYFNLRRRTDLRSALVSRNTFAKLAISLQLHKAFLHSSPPLYELIQQYCAIMASDLAPFENKVLVYIL